MAADGRRPPRCVCRGSDCSVINYAPRDTTFHMNKTLSASFLQDTLPPFSAVTSATGTPIHYNSIEGKYYALYVTEICLTDKI